MIDSSLIQRARAVPLQHELRQRGIRLRPSGAELVGPCPRCGGTDRFSVHLRKQVWNCRRCEGKGSVIDFVMMLDGVNFAQAVEILTGGDTRRRAEIPHVPPPVRASTDTGTDMALALWGQAMPIAGTIAETYLTQTRRLVVPAGISPRVLRFHPNCPFGKERHPCLLALYRSIVGDEPRAIMRTALTPGAKKIDRKALGLVGGAAVKLSADEDVTNSLTVGEGLESTLAGMMKGLAPAWALGSSGAIAKLPVLAGIEALTILAETGDGGANERATRECFDRWHAAVREVYRATSTIGGDMNDGVMAVA